MLQYIGTKIIHAETQSAPCKVGEYPIGSLGYKVIYEDGYASWSPKDVFDNAYRLCDAMTFGLAIEAMKKGKWVKLPYWSDDVTIAIQVPVENSKMSAPYFYVTSRFGMVPWIPTMIEMFSEKWQIVD